MKWSLRNVCSDASKLASVHVKEWEGHVDLFDDTVAALYECRFVHPWRNEAAGQALEEREAQALAFSMAPHAVPAIDPQVNAIEQAQFPDGEPGSEAEAQSYCLHLLTLSLLRSLVRSGYLCIAGLALEAMGTHRRSRETLPQIELILDSPTLAIECWRLARQHDTKARRANPFIAAEKQVTQRVSNTQQYPDSVLTPLQLKLRQSRNDAGLHLGPHAGIHHGLVGSLGPTTFTLFDVKLDSTQVALWRFSAEIRQLVSLLAPKLTWFDQTKWRALEVGLAARSKVMEKEDRQRIGRPTPGSTPWSEA